MIEITTTYTHRVITSQIQQTDESYASQSSLWKKSKNTTQVVQGN